MPPPNKVLFSAFAPATGTELWVSDGTTAGTSMVKDIFPGNIGSSSPTGFTQFGSQVLFAATDQTHGFELWTTDGTSAGTALVKDVLPGTGSGFQSSITGSPLPTSLRPAGGKMVFLGTDGAPVKELWVTDGTGAGTSLLKTFDPDNTFPAPGNFAAFGNRQLFQASDGLHRSGPDDGRHGAELWVTDGTTAGTSMVKDINPAVYGSGSPSQITDLGASGRAVFSANGGGSIGRELWVTDGTAGGTSLLKDINPGFYTSSNPGPATLVGTTGRAVFAAIGSTVGTELWVTDGTTPGTSLLKTFSNGYRTGGFAFLGKTAGIGTFQTFGNQVLFSGSDAGVSAVWATDGTVAGTVRLASDGVFVSGLADGSSGFTALGGKELFWTSTGGFSHPWITDGTPAGTVQLSTTASLGQPYGFGVVGAKAVFSGSSTVGQELWVTDGTAAGTSLLADINTLTNGSSYPKNFASIGSKVVFQATDSNFGTELWVTDGTSSGTFQAKDINNNTYHSSTPSNITPVTLACFAAGTQIRTTRGETPVETLRAGDLVVTAAGQHRPVRWIGHRSIALANHPRPHDVAPVCIAPHAFGENQPHAALRISPDHAVFADGVLIPIRYLVNGTTIARESVDRVTWYHVELAGPDGAALHDVLLAEGLASESYLDTGNRSAFANGGAAIDLHPDFARAIWQRAGCAPLIVEGPEITALRGRLLERAASLGHGRTGDAALSFSLDTRNVRPTRDAAWYHFAIPAGTLTLHLHSRAAVPAEITADGSDTRNLGVALTALRLDASAAALDHPRLSKGWHDVERGLRWTGGTATLDVRGLTRISVALHFAPVYWDETPELARTARRRRLEQRASRAAAGGGG